MDRELDYLLPASFCPVEIGTIVRVPLAGRRLRGWLTALDTEPPDGIELRKVLKVVGRGPGPELVELSSWAAWRWAGRRVRFLRCASPERIVEPGLFPPMGIQARVDESGSTLLRVPPAGDDVAAVLLRVPPAGDDVAAVMPHIRRWMRPDRSVLLMVPELARIAAVSAHLRHEGLDVAAMPGEWARAAQGGCVVIGSRAAAWAPAPSLGGVVVLDAHDERYREETAPTWDACVIAEERARRAAAPFLAVSACPTVELLHGRRVETVSRRRDREGWAPLEIVDMAREDPQRGMFSARLAGLLCAASVGERSRVLCVLNRKGRATLLTCADCRRLARCGACGVALKEIAVEESGRGRSRSGGQGTDGEDLICPACGTTRPTVCAECGATRLKRLRPGVARIAEELTALAGRTVAEVTGDMKDSETQEASSAAAIVVGTEAVLFRLPAAGAVAFLDFDRELTAPRYSAGARALGLLARASRIVGGRAWGGRVLIQTRIPGHDVIGAALHADPSLFTGAERSRRETLRLPPFAAMARITGTGAAEKVRGITETGITEAAEFAPGTYLVRASTHEELCASLDRARAVPVPRARVRIEVDPAE